MQVWRLLVNSLRYQPHERIPLESLLVLPPSPIRPSPQPMLGELLREQAYRPVVLLGTSQLVQDSISTNRATMGWWLSLPQQMPR